MKSKTKEKKAEVKEGQEIFLGRLPSSGVKRDWETDPDRTGGWPPAPKQPDKEER